MAAKVCVAMQETAFDKVMVASFLDKPEEGERFLKMPAHLTYVSWFQLPHDKRESFHGLIEDIIEEERPPVITGGSQRIFTDPKTGELQRVRRLDVPTAGFNGLQDFAAHAALFAFAKNIDPSFDAQYFGMNWAPHVSETPDRELRQGEVVDLDNLTVVRRLKVGQKVAEKVFDWRRYE